MKSECRGAESVSESASTERWSLTQTDRSRAIRRPSVYRPKRVNSCWHVPNHCHYHTTTEIQAYSERAIQCTTIVISDEFNNAKPLCTTPSRHYVALMLWPTHPPSSHNARHDTLRRVRTD